MVFDLEHGLGEVFKNALTQALLDSTSSCVHPPLSLPPAGGAVGDLLLCGLEGGCRCRPFAV